MHSSFIISSSKRLETIDISNKIEEIIKKSKIKNGLCTVFVPHATAAIIINENWDPNVGVDFQQALAQTIPAGKWLHDQVDDNGDSHIKSALVGPSATIPIIEGKLPLGQWQSIMLAEFDGPKERKVIVSLMGDS